MSGTRRDSTPPVIAFIGIGLMGRPMARHLLAAGYPVRAQNRTAAKAEALVADGAVFAATPAAAAEGTDIVIVMVSDTPSVEAALFGPDGVTRSLADGALVIDMGTTAVMATREFARRIAERGGRYVDAPVSGGQVGAEEKTLSIMVGGAEADVAEAMPLFQAMGRRVTHVGPVGAGQVAKTANQMVVGLTIGAVAEALTLAEAAGVSSAKVREALMGGFADSRILELHGKRMVERAFTPGGKVTTQAKDMHQAADLAQALGLDLPALALNRDLYDRLIAQGDGALDHSALIRLFVRQD